MTSKNVSDTFTGAGRSLQLHKGGYFRVKCSLNNCIVLHLSYIKWLQEHFEATISTSIYFNNYKVLLVGILVVTPSRLVSLHQCFGGTFCQHLQVWTLASYSPTRLHGVTNYKNSPPSKPCNLESECCQVHQEGVKLYTCQVRISKSPTIRDD